MVKLRSGAFRREARGNLPVRVLIADDNELFAKTLEAMLAGEQRVELVGVAHEGKQAVELAEQLRPDIVLMDIAMPVLDGFEATRILRQRRSNARVLVLTASVEHGDADRALREGAYGYLTKDRIATELVPAVLHIAGVEADQSISAAERAG
jgi:DNA-binding NarL/FixJ family response regulator